MNNYFIRHTTQCAQSHSLFTQWYQSYGMFVAVATMQHETTYIHSAYHAIFFFFLWVCGSFWIFWVFCFLFFFILFCIFWSDCWIFGCFFSYLLFFVCFEQQGQHDWALACWATLGWQCTTAPPLFQTCAKRDSHRLGNCNRSAEPT